MTQIEIIRCSELMSITCVNYRPLVNLLVTSITCVYYRPRVNLLVTSMFTIDLV